MCTANHSGRTCNLDGAGTDLSELDKILNGTTENYDRTIEAVLDRMSWTDMVVVIDVTGSMRTCATLVYRWMKKNQGPVNPIEYYVFFNDGDDKVDSLKVIGSTGGLYGVSSADGPENDIEALLFAIEQCPTCLNVVHIADNSATPRDKDLVDTITKPVHVIPCQLNGKEINPELISIASKTGGSSHTLTKDDMTYSRTFYSNDHVSKMKIRILSILDCSIPKIKLVSKPSSLSSIEYKLNEEIFISLNFQSSEELLLITYQWIIYKCTPRCSDLIQLDGEIQTTSNEIYIPPKKLTYGTYRLYLTIKNSSNSVCSLASVDIEIILPTKIIVNLIKYQTSKITVQQNQEIFFQPDKYSRYEDGEKLSPEVWRYEYYCRINNLLNPEEAFVKIENSSCFFIQSGKTVD